MTGEKTGIDKYSCGNHSIKERFIGEDILKEIDFKTLYI